MEYRTLYNKEKIPILGLGTWGMGGGVMRSIANDQQEINAIKAAIKLGITHIDTAEFYGNGHAEELVGVAIKGFDRKKLFITTKVWSTHLGYNGVIEAAEGSLQRMKLKYMDLYLIHWPNFMFPLKKTMEAMDYLIDTGMTRFIGVSNFSVKQMKDAQAYSKHSDFVSSLGNNIFPKHGIVTNQVEYSLLHRYPEKELLPYCQENGIILTAYTPLAKGTLSQWGYNAVLDSVARKYKKTPGQVALNWLISQKNVIAIPKASKIEHIKDNSGAVGWKMSKEDFEGLSGAF